MESNWKFQRGDIYFVKLEAGVGSEQNGARPAVILQNDVGNIYSPTLIVAALTSKTDKKVTQATHCQVEEDGLKPSIVQAEQIFTMKNDIAVAQRLGITATTLEGILTVKGQGRR